MDRLRRVILIFALVGAVISVSAQQALPPERHGGNFGRTIDLRDPGAGTIRKSTRMVFDKQNPGARAMAPRTRNCYTEEAEQAQAAFAAGATENDTLFEQWMQESLRERQRSRSLFRFGPEEVLTIPVVVHVVYSSAIENISDAQVLSQIQALNQDYRRQNPDQNLTPREFRNLATDTGIEFCLANVDPRGNPTNGIHRVSFAGAPFTERSMNEVVKPATIWDPNRYFNIWVCRLADDVLGFASFPVSSGLSGVPAQRAAATTDGVVIHYAVFGTTGTVMAPFNKGRTTTHEVGHWLGLRHVWGDGPCGVDDFVQDTPESDGPHFGCPQGAAGCRGGVAMIQNYMDYSDDACMNLFTRDQKERMRTVLKNSPRRGSLLESGACVPPLTPPEPAFAANITQGCAPLDVRFADQSKGKELSWQWSFPGGRPSTSNQPSPEVSYREPGVYAVSLRVSNPAGNRSVTREGFITVTSVGKDLPYAVSFEPDQLSASAGFFLDNKDNDYTWSISERIGAHGTSAQALTINNFDNKLVNSADWFLLPVLDFSGQTTPELSFDLSYALFNSRFSDTLGVFVTTGCGTLFRNIYYKGGDKLSTVNRQVMQPFSPDDQEWRKERIDLSFLAGQPNVQIAFINFNGNGNDLYLDNIRVGSPLPPAPKPQFAVSVTQACAGETVKFDQRSTGTVTEYIWSFPGGTPASSREPSPAVSYGAAGIYDVILTVRGPGGEQSITKAGAVSITAAPALVVEGDREICAGEKMLLRASGGNTYRWSVGNTVKQEGNSGSFEWTPSSDEVVTVVATGNQCTATRKIPVRVMAVRPLTITPASAEICPGETVDLQATGARSYVWTPAPPEAESRSGSFSVSPAATTTYRVEGVNDLGCQLSAEVTITVHESPGSFTVNAPKTVLCPGESVELTASGANSFRWSPTVGLNQASGARVLCSPTSPTTYRIEGINEFGCMESRQIRIDLATFPNVQIRSLSSLVCQGEEVVLQARGAVQYDWFPLEFVTGQGSEVRGKPAEDQVFTVIGRTEAGCADTAQVFVQVRQPEPIELVASNDAVCPGESAQLTVNGGADHQWANAPGLSNSRGSRVTVRPSRDQTYTVYARDRQGCETSASKTIQVSAGRSAYAEFSADQTVTCAGQEVSFRALSPDARAFRWEFEGGEPGYSTEANPTVTFPYEGSFSVRLEVRGCDGRPNRQERTNFIYVTAPAAISLNQSDRIVCRGEEVPLVASGGRTYTWSPSTGLDRTSGASVLAQPLATTRYTVTGTDANGCEVSTNVTLEVVSPKDVKVSPGIASICRGDSVLLEASGALDYAWTTPQERSERREPAIFARPSTTTTYRLKATDLNGCIYNREVIVEVTDSISLQVEADRMKICEGESVTLFARGASVVQWSPANALSAPTGNRIDAFPGETTTFFATGTNEAGCLSRKSITIEVEPVQPMMISAQDSTICPGQGTLLTASGGVDYAWSPTAGLDRTNGPIVTASPDQTTTYTVSRSQGGCGGSAQITVEVKEPEPLLISPTTTRICQGDHATLQVSGGTRYVWDLAEGLSTVAGAEVIVTPGTTTEYTVHSLDERNCELTGTATVVVIPSDFVTVATSASTICAGEEITLTASGALAYSWIPDPTLVSDSGARVYANPTIGNVYTVIGENEDGCRDSATVEVFVREFEAFFTMTPDQVDLANGPALVQFEGELEGAAEYAWDFGGTGSAEVPNPMHIFTQPGRYAIRYAASDGICVSRTQRDLVVVNSSSLDDVLDEGDIEVRKAGNGRFVLAFTSPRDMYLNLRLLDSEGTELLSGALRPGPGAFSQEFDLSSYPAGTYFIRMSDGEVTKTFTLNR